MRNLKRIFIAVAVCTTTLLAGCSKEDIQDIKEIADIFVGTDDGTETPTNDNDVETYTNPEDLTTYTYSGKPYVVIDDNVPDFTEAELSKATESFEEYGELDNLGRCTEAVASVGQDIMPTGKRGSISSVKPTGWQSVKYDNVDGKYLYNRCHLIGYQLTGENANKSNLITGTRYLNIDGMLDTEDSVANYVKETGNHVLYRVTPVFKDNELVARGVRMEGYSIEDNGEGICFDIYSFNVQPGIEINYEDGTSTLE